MLDWKIGEDDDTPENLAEALPRRRWRVPRWLWMGTLGIVLVAALTTAAYFFLGVREGEAKARAEIQQAADLEIWARQNDNRVVFFESLDPAAPRDWRTRQVRDWREGEEWRAGAKVVRVELNDDLAWVELELTNKAGKVFREGRFYRRGADGRWRRSAGSDDFWGPSRVIETKYFQVQHHLRDAPYVRQATEGLDEWYGQVRADFGLPAPTGFRVIDIVADPEAASSANLVVKSPLLDLRTGDDTPANNLRGWIAYKLAEELMNDILPTTVRTSSTAYRSLLTGVLYWEVSQVAPFTPSEQTELRLILSQAAASNSLIPPSQLMPTMPDEAGQRLLWPQQVATGAFIADTYGRASFAKLLRQTGTSLEQTVPRALGVTYTAFEQNWRRYVQQKYTS
ncbi:MAG: hypothetical protein KIT87_01120 [Anaerolineae bacterium]|nr:hypothetical protein [Anaerolineae bacterium]